MTGNRPSTTQARTLLYLQAVRIIEREFGDQLELDALALRVSGSRRQLQRAFAEAGGTTFRDHLTGVRIDRAADLLRTTELPVREIANRVGYRQHAQFAKAFRRLRGRVPSAYRAAARSSDASIASRA